MLPKLKRVYPRTIDSDLLDHYIITEKIIQDRRQRYINHITQGKFLIETNPKNSRNPIILKYVASQDDQLIFHIINHNEETKGHTKLTTKEIQSLIDTNIFDFM